MSTIGNLSGPANPFYMPPASGSTQSTGAVDSDGDNDGSGGAAQIGKGSGFMQSILQVLGQTVSAAPASSATTTSATSAPSQDSGSTQGMQASLQAFMHDLFAALHQQNGNGKTAAGAGDADGDRDGSVSGARHAGRHGGMAGKIQNLLQQLSASSQDGSTAPASNSSDALSALNVSFQNLVKAFGNGQPADAASSPTLQAFLQNLQQNLGGGQSIAGAVVNTQA